MGVNFAGMCGICSCGIESLPFMKLLLDIIHGTTLLGISGEDMQGQRLHRNMKMCK